MRSTLFSSSPAFCIALVMLLASFLFANMTLPHIAQKGEKVVGDLIVETIRLTPSRFGQRLYVTGTMNNLPVSLYFPKKEQRMLKKFKTIHVEGTMSQISFGHYWLELNKKGALYGVDPGYSLAHMRLDLKTKLQEKIALCYDNDNCSSLISALLLGTAPHTTLSHSFSRFGLQHLLAISGFHFGLLSLFTSFLLGRLCPYRLLPLISALLMSLYALILDPGPSVLRALVTFLAMQASFSLCRESSSLNRLGVALIAVLLFDPTYCLKIGFQFSFAVTASILLFFDPIDVWLKDLFTIEKNTFWAKHIKLIAPFFRKLLSLTLAVQLTALPLTLYWFQSFPLLSLLYNFFFPVLIGISLALFLAALFFPPLHMLNELLLTGLLRTFNVPAHRDIFIKTPPFHWIVIALWFALLLALAKRNGSTKPILEFY